MAYLHFEHWTQTTSKDVAPEGSAEGYEKGQAMIMYTPTSETPNSEGAGVVLKPKKKRKFPLRDVEHSDRPSPIHPAKAMKVMRRKSY